MASSCGSSLRSSHLRLHYEDFIFFIFGFLRIYTLYVIFRPYGSSLWKSSLRSPIKIFSPQDHFSKSFLSWVYVIYGENTFGLFCPPIGPLWIPIRMDFWNPKCWFYKVIFIFGVCHLRRKHLWAFLLTSWSSLSSYIWIFETQNFVWFLSWVYVIYGENTLGFFRPLLVLFKFLYIDFDIDHVEKPRNLYFHKPIIHDSSAA